MSKTYYGSMNICLLVLILTACDFKTGIKKPMIKLHIGATVSEVQKNSTLQFKQEFMQGIPGAEFINTPHIFIYEDKTLQLHISNAASLEKLPTTIGYSTRFKLNDPESIINYVSVYPISDYLALENAINEAQSMQEELLRQGFLIKNREPKTRFDANWKNPPTLNEINDLKLVFLNSTFFAKSAIVFEMEKGDVNIEMLLTNLRRKWGSRLDKNDKPIEMLESDRIENEKQSISPEHLATEQSYSLVLNIGRSDANRKSLETKN